MWVFPLYFAVSRISCFIQCPKPQEDVNNFRVALGSLFGNTVDTKFSIHRSPENAISSAQLRLIVRRVNRTYKAQCFLDPINHGPFQNPSILQVLDRCESCSECAYTLCLVWVQTTPLEGLWASCQHPVVMSRSWVISHLFLLKSHQQPSCYSPYRLLSRTVST